MPCVVSGMPCVCLVFLVLYNDPPAVLYHWRAGGMTLAVLACGGVHGCIETASLLVLLLLSPTLVPQKLPERIDRLTCVLFGEHKLLPFNVR